MSEIPADVMQAAEAVMDEIIVFSDADQAREYIAAAIMAERDRATKTERERCAKTVRNWKDDLVPGELIENAVHRLAERIEAGQQ